MVHFARSSKDCTRSREIQRAERERVELQVPASQRGPGWDRHGLELEAYLETPMTWQGLREETTGDIEDDEWRTKRAFPYFFEAIESFFETGLDAAALPV
jgi:hypothetical protein